MTDKLEIMARAIASVEGSQARPFHAKAQAALDALAANGFAVVPVEPTDAMVDAGENDGGHSIYRWAAMIAAAD